MNNENSLKSKIKRMWYRGIAMALAVHPLSVTKAAAGDPQPYLPMQSMEGSSDERLSLALNPAATRLGIPSEAAEAAVAAEESVLKKLMQAYFADETNFEGDPVMAARIVDEVFNEEGLVLGKVWELRSFMEDLARAGNITEAVVVKTAMLEHALISVAQEKRSEGFLEDFFYIGGISILAGILGGYHFSPSRVIAAIQSTRSSAANVGQNVRQSKLGTFMSRFYHAFAGLFRRLTPEETVARDLFALGMKPLHVERIKDSASVVSPQDAFVIESTITFFRTNKRSLKVAAVSPPSYSNSHFGYLLFKKGGPTLFHRKRKPIYIKTRTFAREDLEEIMQGLYRGKDRRVFVELVPENGVAQETRVVADDLAAASATSGASAAPRVRVPTFDRLHAERIALGTAGALSVGYIIAVKHSLNMTNLYIGSLFQGIEEENKRRPAHQGQ